MFEEEWWSSFWQQEEAMMPMIGRTSKSHRCQEITNKTGWKMQFDFFDSEKVYIYSINAWSTNTKTSPIIFSYKRLLLLLNLKFENNLRQKQMRILEASSKRGTVDSQSSKKVWRGIAHCSATMQRLVVLCQSWGYIAVRSSAQQSASGRLCSRSRPSETSCNTAWINSQGPRIVGREQLDLDGESLAVTLKTKNVLQICGKTSIQSSCNLWGNRCGIKSKKIITR